MKPMKNHPDREISPQTEQRFFYAYAREFPLPGRQLLFINLWTESFQFLPTWSNEYSVPWWTLETTVQNKVNIFRFYWLCFGIAYVRPTY